MIGTEGIFYWRLCSKCCIGSRLTAANNGSAYWSPGQGEGTSSEDERGKDGAAAASPRREGAASAGTSKGRTQESGGCCVPTDSLSIFFLLVCKHWLVVTTSYVMGILASAEKEVWVKKCVPTDNLSVCFLLVRKHWVVMTIGSIWVFCEMLTKKYG